MPKVEEFCHFYTIYRRDAERAKFFYLKNFYAPAASPR